MPPVSSPARSRVSPPLSTSDVTRCDTLRKIMTLARWPTNLGPNAPPMAASTVLLCDMSFAKLTSVCEVHRVLVPDATTTMVPWKLVCLLRPLASVVQLTTRRKTPKTLGRVPLTLLKSSM